MEHPLWSCKGDFDGYNMDEHCFVETDGHGRTTCVYCRRWAYYQPSDDECASPAAARALATHTEFEYKADADALVRWTRHASVSTISDGKEAARAFAESFVPSRADDSASPAAAAASVPIYTRTHTPKPAAKPASFGTPINMLAAAPTASVSSTPSTANSRPVFFDDDDDDDDEQFWKPIW